MPFGDDLSLRRPNIFYQDGVGWRTVNVHLGVSLTGCPSVPCICMWSSATKQHVVSNMGAHGVVMDQIY